jgi:hypothetical protein
MIHGINGEKGTEVIKSSRAFEMCSARGSMIRNPLVVADCPLMLQYLIAAPGIGVAIGMFCSAVKKRL